MTANFPFHDLQCIFLKATKRFGRSLNFLLHLLIYDEAQSSCTAHETYPKNHTIEQSGLKFLFFFEICSSESNAKIEKSFLLFHV